MNFSPLIYGLSGVCQCIIGIGSAYLVTLHIFAGHKALFSHQEENLKIHFSADGSLGWVPAKYLLYVFYMFFGAYKTGLVLVIFK